MTQQQITEGNKLIAEFMGKEFAYPYYKEYEYENFIKALKYHSSWDWLMPVVEKIESLGYAFTIIQNSCFIKGSVMGDRNKYVKRIGYSETKIESTWLAVVEFIKWYNQEGGAMKK